MDTYLQILAVVGGTVTVLSAAIGALWAYTRYVVERGVLPSTRVDVDLCWLGMVMRKQGDDAEEEAQLVEVRIDVDNLGSSVLVVGALWVDLRCIDGRVAVEPFPDGRKLGRTNFGESVLPQWTGAPSKESDRVPPVLGGDAKSKKSGVPVVPHATFVNPKVKQTYTYVTTLSADARFVLVIAKLHYVAHLNDAQEITLSLARFFGMTSFTLANVSQPHTRERVFALDEEREKARTGGSLARE